MACIHLSVGAHKDTLQRKKRTSDVHCTSFKYNIKEAKTIMEKKTHHRISKTYPKMGIEKAQMTPFQDPT
ncbi:uncharacterized protein G2W53_040348 [Senna tora]|uniref:Uncharacterized protein n=1 Tax=Senna tora TaxID=362788 RepID=A0A834SDF1_9FABA|nr:uncharacterized protein G2W53_040348 [Senna tora]